MTLPANVYVVLATSYPVVFVNEVDACDFANISGNEPVHTCALRSREDAAELLSEFTANDESLDPTGPGSHAFIPEHGAPYLCHVCGAIREAHEQEGN